MPIFAIVDENNVVTNRVISDSVEMVQVLFEEPILIVQESPETGTAYIGEKFLASGIFQSPKPFDSWAWNDDLIAWVAPTECPADGLPYRWDEASLSWVAVNEEVAPLEG